MLKKIPDILSSDILKCLMDMGHGEELVIADANFPATGTGQRVLYAKGVNIPDLLEAVLKFFPLDNYVSEPVGVMQPADIHRQTPTVWSKYKQIIAASEECEKFTDFEHIGRDDFYERTRKAFAVVSTSETCLYANVILKKGVV